jgi:hypothetical protein
VCRRIAWLALGFFAIYVPVNVVSFYLLPEGVLRGSHPVIDRLKIFACNHMPTTLIVAVAGNLLAQESRLVKDRFVPVGCTAF